MSDMSDASSLWEDDASSVFASPDEWGSAVVSGDATKLTELVLLWSATKPERALSILRDCVSLLEKKVNLSTPASPAIPSAPTTPGPTRNSCLNALIVALNETYDGKSWYTSTKELQLASMEFCMTCRNYQTMHLIIESDIPRRLLAAADAPPSHPKRLFRTRVPRLRARGVTWHIRTATELSIPISAMTDADCLEFGDYFEGGLEAVAWPQRLKTIVFYEASVYNRPINLVQWPASLQRLQFGSMFNQPVDGAKFPASLQELTFGSQFNQSIEGVILPCSLQQLKLGMSFNQAIEGVTWPPSLGKLTFGKDFNQPTEGAKFPASLQELMFDFGSQFNQLIAGVILPSSLQKLRLGITFNQPIERVAWTPSLEQLELGKQFNQPIERAKFPASLKHLMFDVYSVFDQPIAQVAWPTSLQQLRFGEQFNQPIEGSVWPDSLQRLVFGDKFNQPVENVRWPASLQEDTFGWCDDQAGARMAMYSDFNQPIGSSIWPASLRRLTVGEQFRQSLQGLGTWMPNLESLRLLDWDLHDLPNDSLLCGIEWPKELGQLTVFKESSLDGVVIPSSVQVVRGAAFSPATCFAMT